MSEDNEVSVTVVGGRPSPGAASEWGSISPGLRLLLERLAEDPSLAHRLVSEPSETLESEGLEVTSTEFDMLSHLGVDDLAQTRSLYRSTERPCGPAATRAKDVALQERKRWAAKLALVAPFMESAEAYISDGTRGIRPQSIYPTPYAVAEALVRSSEPFREALLEDAEDAILNWAQLPLNDQERQELIHGSVLERLRRVAKHA